MKFYLFTVLLYTSIFEISKQDYILCNTHQDYDRRGANNHVKCKGDFLEATVLQEAIRNISHPIHIFEIYNSSMELLPEDIFSEKKNAKVRKFILSNSSLSLLAIREYNVPPFHSVEETLESIEVYHSSLVFAWNFSALSSIANLKTIVIENSEFFTVPDTFKLWPSLRFVQLIKCYIHWVHKEAFKRNTNMRILSLSHNFIEKISRKMFPQPATYLWSLDLSYNKLEHIPTAIFDDMYALRELKLDFNELKVTGDHLKFVWNRLSHLWLNGNKIVCWSMCSILHSKREKKDRPQFFDSSTCVLPPKEEILLDAFSC